MRLRLLTLIAATAVLVSVAPRAFGCAPSPEAVEKWEKEGVLEEKMAAWHKHHPGGSKPATTPALPTRAARGLATADAPDTMYVPVVLVDFPDYKWDQSTYTVGSQTVLTGGVSATPDDFQDLLFSRSGEPGNPPNGSFTDFYFEASNGKLVVIGDIFGWHTAPNNYETYVQGAANGLSGGGADLAYDAVWLAKNEGGADFSKYDNNNNGIVEGLIVIHAGPGAETGAYGIWSHRSVFSPAHQYDGVTISDYTMNPEEYSGNITTIGVICHEFGHALGLPDLYDLNPNQSLRRGGIGRWSVMASGSWNGNGGDIPSQFDAWSRFQLNQFNNTDVFGEVIVVESNMGQVEIPAATSNAVTYALRDRNDPIATDVWFVENRQREGFDAALPGEGLFIWHWDREVTRQDNANRYMVGLEQADGLFQLENSGGGGDSGDPFPGGTNNREFSVFTNPSAISWNGDSTQVSVDNISDNGPVMYADLNISYNRARIVLIDEPDSVQFLDAAPGGNANGVLEAGETISFDMGVRNIALAGNFGKVTVTPSNPAIVMSNNGEMKMDKVFNTVFDEIRLDEPLTFTIPTDWASQNVTFNVVLAIDSVFNPEPTTGEWEFEFNFTRLLGRPQVLIVDDDASTASNKIAALMDRINRPYGMHVKDVSGSPDFSTLSSYPIVLWHTGTNQPGQGGTLTSADISALKQYLDNGGSLILSTLDGIGEMEAIDADFVTSYLRVLPDSQVFRQVFRGVDSDPISDGLVYQLSSGATGFHRIINPGTDARTVFDLVDNPIATESRGSIGVVYESSSYRTMVLTFALEFASPGSGSFPLDTLVDRVIAEFARGAATDVDDDNTGTVLPRSFTLDQNYPNPFNPTTTISYTIGSDSETGRPARVLLEVFNVLGQRITTLVDRVQPPGSYSVDWNGRSDDGTVAATGIYFYRLQFDGASQARKMVLLK